MAARGGLAGSAAVMFSGTLVSRALGLARNALMVAAIGVTGSGAADAFSVANKLPNIIYMLLAGGILNAVLVPQVVRAMRREDGGTEYVNRLLTIAGAFMLAVTVALTAASGLLVTLYAADFRSGAWAPLAVTFAIWCIPQLFFYGMYTLLGQVLNARNNFGPYMWAPALNNVISIAGLVAYLIVYGAYSLGDVPAHAWDGQRIALLAGPWTLGVAAQAAVLILPLRASGFRFRPRWGLRGSGLRSTGRVAMWAFAALAVGQLGYLGVSNLAAAAGTAATSTGSPDPSIAGNAAYDNAFLIFMLPQSLITVSLVTALFTRLSEHAVGQQTFRVRDDLSRGLRILAVFTVFAAGAFMVLAIPLTQLVQFDQATFASYQAIGHVLVAMLLGLPAIAIWTMAQRVYFAFEDTRFLFFVQVPMALVQLGGSLASFLLLDVRWWVAGAGLSTAASNTLGGLVAYLALRRRLPSLDGARVLRTYLRVLLAAVPAAGIGWGVLHLWGVQTSFLGALLRVVALGALMGLIYYVLLRRLRVSELDQLTDRVGAMLAPVRRRLAPLAAGIVIPVRLRTIWARIIGVDGGNGGPRVNDAAEPALESGATVADRYVVDTPVRTDSSQSTAWLGHDDILQRRVLLTVLGGKHREDALDAARRAALVREARLQRIWRVGHHQDIAYIVTEPIDGPSLRELLAGGPLPPAQARALVGNAATALEAARKRGVHHLRLRPEALRLTTDGTVVVTGLAVDAAHAGIELPDARIAARADALALVGLLYTALTGYWPGPAERAGGLPPAPRSGSAPVPPSELVAGVPHDLDSLCVVAFGPHHDGPYTPGELVRELQPWDSLDPASTDGRGAPAQATGVVPAGAAEGHGGDPVADASHTQANAGTAILPTPGRGLRTGAGAAVAGGAVAGAAGAGVGAAGAGAGTAEAGAGAGETGDGASGAGADAAEAGAGAAAEDPASVPASASASAPARPTPPLEGWDLPPEAATPAEDDDRAGGRLSTDAAAAAGKVAAGAGKVAAGARGLLDRARAHVEVEDDEGIDEMTLGSGNDAGHNPHRRRFNAAPWVIFAMVAILVLALILALGSLRDARTSFAPGTTTPPAAQTTTPAPTETTEEPSQEETESPPPEPADISFSEAESLDPSTGSGDNTDLAGRAIDGDPETVWRSLRYDNPEYGMKPGLGFAVVLDEPTEVTSVTLDVLGEGGTVQIRNTSPEDPSGGEVLAEGAMGPDTTYTLSTPTELDAIVLWFPKLPVADSDGRNRIELAEVTAN